MSTTPEVNSRYLKAADARDTRALVACFTHDGTVLDEGHTYRGHDQISAWRNGQAAKYRYTTQVTGSQPVSVDVFRVNARIEGDFPGGVVDLTFDFTLADGLIADLSIG
ncbi:MAG: hypothetical protein QOI76_2172 [Frankiales bacterium]|nr:hypothetical protein [Frankiales bacterium]